MRNGSRAKESADAEKTRLAEDARREKNWKRWGPYLPERQWGTVREDYSADGTCWDYLPHDHARSRAYRWGEDGLLGITDRECRLCFAIALWNGRDPILKERLFGLTGPEGNHGEDVKECYFYLDATPTGSYLKALYKYPQCEYPYARLVDEGRRRGKRDTELELVDTGVFDDGRYFDVTVEYAKASPDDILIRVTVANRGPEAAPLHVLPTLWFRNTWSWDRDATRPRLHGMGRLSDCVVVRGEHPTLPHAYRLFCEGEPDLLFTENETNFRRLWGAENTERFLKDAFHEYLIQSHKTAVNPSPEGTKVAAHYQAVIGSGETMRIRLRLTNVENEWAPFGASFDQVVTLRREEANEFYSTVIPADLSDDARSVMRQAL